MDTEGVKSVQPQTSHWPFCSAACRPERRVAWRLPQGFSLLLTVVIASLVFVARFAWAITPPQSDGWPLRPKPQLFAWSFDDGISTVGPLLEPRYFSPLRFTVFLPLWDRDDVPFFLSPDFLSEAPLHLPDPASREVYATAFEELPLLAWVNYYAHEALQWHLSQFVLPSDFLLTETPVPLPVSLSRARPLSRQLTVAQLHGTLGRRTRPGEALHYALYTGVLAEDTPDHLLVGARLGYMSERGGFTIGIDYLYSELAGSPDLRERAMAARARRLFNGEGQEFLLALLVEQQSLLVSRLRLPGTLTSDTPPLAVHAKPVLHLNRQWTIFYRFNHLSFGAGLPKITDHVFGVRFLPWRNVYLRAEFIRSSYDHSSIDAEGLRLSATVRF
jgi:hypothetical protein